MSTSLKRVILGATEVGFLNPIIKRSGDTVLEVGFGEGRKVLQLLIDGFEVHAIDRSFKRHAELNVFIEANSISKDRLVPYQIDLTEFDFNSFKGYFSCVVCQNVLHFFPKDQALTLLTQLQELVKVNGLFLFSAHHINHPDNIPNPQGEHINFYSGDEVDRMFEMNMFQKLFLSVGETWLDKDAEFTLEPEVNLTYIGRKVTKLQL